jgi:hypothetical protein
MSTVRFHLKQPAGWFAAGREVACALSLLSDKAFKLFVWMCLHAERSRGSVCATPIELARSLGKSETEIAVALEELFRNGVCHRTDDRRIEITDRFWPYERLHLQEAPGSLHTYLSRVKQVFLQRGCVRSAFTAADEKLGAQLFRRGVPIENVERAILLGSLRKYAALINHGTGTPITTLHYFTALFEEVNQLEISTQYWAYVAHKVQVLEQQWRQCCLLNTSCVQTETK